MLPQQLGVIPRRDTKQPRWAVKLSHERQDPRLDARDVAIARKLRAVGTCSLDLRIDLTAIDPAIDEVYDSLALCFTLRRECLDWLGDAPPAVAVSFLSMSSDLSRALAVSAPARAFFVALAESSGALACDFDMEDGAPTQLLTRHPRWYDPSSHGDIMERACFFPPGTLDEDALRRKSWCCTRPETVRYEDLDRLLAAAADRESGVPSPAGARSGSRCGPLARLAGR